MRTRGTGRKYIVIVPDGMTDRPLEALGGRTPLQKARTPHLDRLARFGLCGITNNTPRSLNPASDVANMSILGLDPQAYRCNRGPLEALAQDMRLGPKDIVFRMNFVTLVAGKMKDFTAHHISTADARRLVAFLNPAFRRRFGPGIELHAGVSYRNLCVVRDPGLLKDPAHTYVAAHDITDRAVEESWPAPDDIVSELMAYGRELLRDRKRNRTRANAIWLYGQGSVVKAPSLESSYGLSGAMITAVDLLRGIGKILGLDIMKVPGITSYFDTNYANKGRYALKALEDHDFVYVHIEAPDEAGHQGDIREKIRAIERVDRDVVGQILTRIRHRDYRILVLPDHATPISIKTHCHDDVPFVLFDSTSARESRFTAYDEEILRARPVAKRFRRGHELLPWFLTP